MVGLPSKHDHAEGARPPSLAIILDNGAEANGGMVELAVWLNNDCCGKGGRLTVVIGLVVTWFVLLRHCGRKMTLCQILQLFFYS